MGKPGMPVHIFKKERNTIFYKLLKEGVICCKKDFDSEHKDTGLPNLKVWMLARTMHSKGYLDLTYSWQYYYYTLNDEGIEYLRKKLGIGAEDVKPATQTKIGFTQRPRQLQKRTWTWKRTRTRKRKRYERRWKEIRKQR